VLRDGATGAPVGPAITEHADTVTGLAFSPDGKTLASTGYDGNLILRTLGDNPAPGAAPATRPSSTASPGRPTADRSPPPAPTAMPCCGRPTASCPSASPPGRDAALRKVGFSDDGRRLVAVGEDGQVRIHDLARPGNRPVEHAVHRGNVLALVFQPDGSFVTAGSDDCWSPTAAAATVPSPRPCPAPTTPPGPWPGGPDGR
jgi:WD40 repeat protein